jgi:DNA invertase Pin-like site-specific DNA recombinase
MKAYSYIRFSTPEQLKGDSLRRQLEAGEKYAKENGLILDKSLSMQDLGLSAYHGVHRTKGALGKFLKLVEAGQIEKGSVLIVENLDRLSREDVLDALNQFTGIIQAGISIVTLQDGQKYDMASIKQNWAQLIISITYMARANEESSAKSKRLSATWNNKRKKAIEGTAKLTARCPLWLKLSHDRKKYIPIPEACKVVEMIYRLKLAGKGKGVITKELNQMKDIWYPPITKRNKTGGWREDYISKILTTPAVIGTFQPKKRDKDGNKMIVCDPIKDYYPAVIDEELFYQVQDLIKRNSQSNGRGGGQRKKATNLFVHLIRCGRCKHPMHFLNKGGNQNNYLYCDVSRRKLLIEDSEPEQISNDKSDNNFAKKVQANAKSTSHRKHESNTIYQCTAKSVNYNEVERLIFDNLEELNIVDLLPDKDETLIRLNDIGRQLEAISPQKAACKASIEITLESITTTKDKRIREGLEKKLSGFYDKLEQLDKDYEQLMKDKKTAMAESELMRENIDITKSIYKLLSDCEDEQERVVLRLRLRTELQKLIDSIEVYPIQGDHKPIEEVEEGVVQVMRSKSIDRIKIRFKGSRKTRLLFLKSFMVKGLNHV